MTLLAMEFRCCLRKYTPELEECDAHSTLLLCPMLSQTAVLSPSFPLNSVYIQREGEGKMQKQPEKGTRLAFPLAFSCCQSKPKQRAALAIVRLLWHRASLWSCPCIIALQGLSLPLTSALGQATAGTQPPVLGWGGLLITPALISRLVQPSSALLTCTSPTGIKDACLRLARL